MSNYIRHIIYLTPSQIKSFGKKLILPQDYRNLKNKERFMVFLTKTQIKKLDKAKLNKEKVDLKLSVTQFIKTLKHVSKENRKILQLLKEKNKKTQDKINKIKLQLLKEKNKKKQEKINKIKLHLLLKNKPKPKKKSIWDVIELPKANLI